MSKRDRLADVQLYPGVMLRGGEMIILQPQPKNPPKRSAKTAPVNLFARSVDNPVDRQKSRGSK